tara:strand:+ start:112067 stop:112492 length:426 start_codon:yes stop_codon:yes gene_type:complete
VQYGYSISMVIKSFKGRRDVEVHLFRSTWDTIDASDLDWDTLISGQQGENDSSRNVILETFSSEERDTIINYLKEQYSTRITAIRSTPIELPVPSGMTGLSQIAPNKSIGIIEFEKIPSYSLGLPMKGLYDLDRHPPIVEE